MSAGSSNFLLLPIPEIPEPDCARSLKLAVLGARGVGKTALIVRFLTKRFIGDYEPNTGALYTRQIIIDGDHISLQMQETPFASQPETEDYRSQETLTRWLHWADGFVFAFSLTDAASCRAVRPIHQQVRRLAPHARLPLVLIGNKADLPHARQVDTSEGARLAGEMGGAYFEVSARENHGEVHEAFHHVCRETGKVTGGSNGNGEKRRGLLSSRPRSPNMQDLGRRLKQALSSKAKPSGGI